MTRDLVEQQLVHFIAIDLGASSGRLIVAKLFNNRLELEELHRFANEPVKALDHVYWDILKLWHEIKEGLRLYAQRYGEEAAPSASTLGGLILPCLIVKGNS
ncbi:MAG: hypothetical protein R2880_00625 [Deinococcales bacterium]